MMDGLKIAAAMWPGQVALVCVVILKSKTLEPFMETAMYCLLALAFVVAAFVLLSRAFSDPPDQSHPD
jgi:hypothetical protein